MSSVQVAFGIELAAWLALCSLSKMPRFGFEALIAHVLVIGYLLLSFDFEFEYILSQLYVETKVNVLFYFNKR